LTVLAQGAEAAGFLGAVWTTKRVAAVIESRKIANGGDPDKKAVASEFLTLLLMKGPVPAKAIFDRAAEAGVSQKTVRRAADSLDVVKKRKGFGPGSYLEWSLPAGHPALRTVGPAAKPPPAPGGDDDFDTAVAQLLGGSDG